MRPALVTLVTCIALAQAAPAPVHPLPEYSAAHYGTPSRREDYGAPYRGAGHGRPVGNSVTIPVPGRFVQGYRESDQFADPASGSDSDFDSNSDSDIEVDYDSDDNGREPMVGSHHLPGFVPLVPKVKPKPVPVEVPDKKEELLHEDEPAPVDADAPKPVKKPTTVEQVAKPVVKEDTKPAKSKPQPKPEPENVAWTWRDEQEFKQRLTGYQWMIFLKSGGYPDLMPKFTAILDKWYNAYNSDLLQPRPSRKEAELYLRIRDRIANRNIGYATMGTLTTWLENFMRRPIDPKDLDEDSVAALKVKVLKDMQEEYEDWINGPNVSMDISMESESTKAYHQNVKYLTKLYDTTANNWSLKKDYGALGSFMSWFSR